MGEGFLGDIAHERKIVLSLFLVGLVFLIAAVVNSPDGMIDTGSEAVPISGFAAVAAAIGVFAWVGMLVLVQFSVLRTTGRNGEWIWFSFTISGSGLVYYILDAMNSEWVKGA
jgi:hypothetical protein